MRKGEFNRFYDQAETQVLHSLNKGEPADSIRKKLMVSIGSQQGKNFTSCQLDQLFSLLPDY